MDFVGKRKIVLIENKDYWCGLNIQDISDIDAVLPADDLSPVQWERDYFATGKRERGTLVN